VIFKKIIASMLLFSVSTIMMTPIGAKGESKTVMYQNNLQHTGVYETKDDTAAKSVKWKFKTDGRIYSSPVLYNGICYFGSTDDNFYAVNQDGTLKWKFKTKGDVNSTAAIYNNTVYFNSADGSFYAVGLKDGKLKWEFKTKGEKVHDIWDYYLSSPVIYKDTVYFGSGDGNLYALDAKSGKQVWKYNTKGIIHATPAIEKGILYIGNYEGNFYAIDAATGKKIWKFKTIGDTWFPKGEVQGSAAIADGIVYFGCRDYNVYALDAEKGTGKWNFKVPNSWVISTPAIKDGVIYFGTSDAQSYYAMDAKSGEIKWILPLNLNVFCSSAIVGDSLYFGCMNGKLYNVDLAAGKINWTYQTEASKANYAKVFNEEDRVIKGLEDSYNWDMPVIYDLFQSLGSILSSPVVENGVVYFGSTDGYFYALQ
jgi:outer membrane protein assembly factor BamB